MSRMTAGPPHSSRYAPVETIPGDPKLIAKVRGLIAGLQPDSVDLLAAFHRIQYELGYVPPEAVPLLAAQFKTTPALIYGAIDFYSEVRTAPPARTTVEWCSGPACLLKGSTNIRRALEATLGCAMNANTADGALGLRLVQCDGTCHLAPLVRIAGRYLGPLTVSDAVTLGRELKGGPRTVPSPAPGEGQGESPP